MNINDLLIELDKRDTLLANDAASKIRELIKEQDALEAENARLKQANLDCQNWFNALKVDCDKLRSALKDLRGVAYTFNRITLNAYIDAALKETT